MARAGDMVENPMIGDRVTFLEVVADTGGERLRFEWVGERERTFGEGEVVDGPAGVPHAWRNPSINKELPLLSELRPALHMETIIEGTATIMRDLNDKMGAPGHLLRLAVLTDETEGDFYFTSTPARVWMKLFGKLAPLGRLLGCEAQGRQYDATYTGQR